MFFLSKNKNKLFKFTVLFKVIDFSQFHTQKKFKPQWIIWMYQINMAVNYYLLIWKM